jgi:Lrp/AsnC family leucine-responsive transcriptional regulator
MSIDEIDLRILDMLQRNGKLSQARIAGAVGLTTPSVNERIKKMERHGMIRGFVALLDHEKMGLPLTAYVDVCLEHPRFEKAFVDDLEKLLAVQECHYLAGEFGYRLKVKAADPGALADFLQRRIMGIKGVTRIQAQISLSSKKDSTLLPLIAEKPEKPEKSEPREPKS